MAAINILGDLRAKDKGDNNDVLRPVDEFEWGSAKLLRSTDLKKMSREEMRNHLAARNLLTSGNKKDLIARIHKSLEDEALMEKAYVETVETEHNILADLEERGSCYVVGCNNAGQLGLGDRKPRHVFTVVPQTRGMGVCKICVGYDTTFALTEDHSVFVWGGRGVAPMGTYEGKIQDFVSEDKFLDPQKVSYLLGEEITDIAVGQAHCIGMSFGGDCYTWGYGSFGRLGHQKTAPNKKNYDSHTVPTLITDGLPESSRIIKIGAGESHSVAVDEHGKVYTWGHTFDGRLGVGTQFRLGIDNDDKYFYPIPTLISNLAKQIVTQISCGSSHTLAVTKENVYSWGSGSAGKLGQGDISDRLSPMIIDELRGMTVLSIAAASWHSGAVVMLPPMASCGIIYTWGSGYFGQLGQYEELVSLRPKLVEYFTDIHVYAKSIHFGSHHCAMLDSDGEMWTWGSNQNYCLGRTIEEDNVNYTAIPGHVGGFGAIVDRVGRGLVRHVNCGKEYTVVCTYPYEGPSEGVAKDLMEERRIAEEEELERLADIERRKQTVSKSNETKKTREHMVEHLTSVRLCSLCTTCTGFQAHAIKTNICRECGHSSNYHTIVVDNASKEDSTTAAPSRIMTKDMGKSTRLDALEADENQ